MCVSKYVCKYVGIFYAYLYLYISRTYVSLYVCVSFTCNFSVIFLIKECTLTQNINTRNAALSTVGVPVLSYL